MQVNRCKHTPSVLSDSFTFMTPVPCSLVDKCIIIHVHGLFLYWCLCCDSDVHVNTTHSKIQQGGPKAPCCLAARSRLTYIASSFHCLDAIWHWNARLVFYYCWFFPHTKRLHSVSIAMLLLRWPLSLVGTPLHCQVSISGDLLAETLVQAVGVGAINIMKKTWDRGPG